MKSRRFLIFLDILGFDKRAQAEYEKMGLPMGEIRHAYIFNVERRLEKLKAEKSIESYTPKATASEHYDSWLVSAYDVWKALRTVGEALKANLPLEVA